MKRLGLLNVTIPVFNEEVQLADSVQTLETFLEANVDCQCEVVIANNGSTDCTLSIACGLAEQYSNLRVTHLDLPGRGRALKKAWNESTADILSYMDVDLSTDLCKFPELIDSIARGECDIAVGSRLHEGAQVKRGWSRECISRCYNRMVRWACGTHFSDAQCGFKAISRSAASNILPHVEDTGWFFDTELLTIAEKRGYSIFDLPVTWTDDPETRVKILSTAWADLRGLLRLRKKIKESRCSFLPASLPEA